MLTGWRAACSIFTFAGLTASIFHSSGQRLSPTFDRTAGQDGTQTPATASAPAAASETIHIMALDKDGRAVTDLKPEELRVLEDKVEQKIVSVSPARNEPLTIGLFFDISGSRRADQSIGEETRLADELLHSIWREGDLAFLVAFHDTPVVVAAPTQKLEDLDEGLRKISRAIDRGSTALYDALCIVKPERLKAAVGRKVYVVFSDFEDNSSRNKGEDALKIVQEGGVSIFPIILDEDLGGSYSKLSKRRAREQARTFADKTGGEVLIPQSPKQLAATFEHLTDELKASYCVTYSPSPAETLGRRKKKKIWLETTRPHVTLIYPKA